MMVNTVSDRRPARLTRRAVLSAGCGFLALALLSMGCGKSTALQTDPAGTASRQAGRQAGNPQRIAIIQDKSLSTGQTRTPQLQLADLDPLVELLGQTGGELGVGIIHDRSNLGFVRLRIDAPPEEPTAPPKADNPLERRKQEGAFRKQLQEFKAQEQTWEEAMQVRIGEFQKSLEPMLNMPADARWSPVWDAVHRAELFLTEREAGETAPPRRYAILISDGLDDVGARPVPVRSGAQILMVNGAGQLGSLAVLQPQRFESIEAAFRFIAGTEGK